MKSNKKACFFDVDDTLYDQLAPFKAAVVSSYNPGETFPFEAVFKKSRELSDVLWMDYKKGLLSLEELRVERLMRAFLCYGWPLTEEQAIRIQDKYEQEQSMIQLFPGVLPLMQDLLKKEIVIGIITNGPVEHQMKKITNLQLNRYIKKENLFISDAVGIAKPNHHIFKHVCERVGIEAGSCFYIGDSWKNDVIPSTKAGWNSIWFNYRRQPEANDQPHLTISSYVDPLLKKIR